MLLIWSYVGFDLTNKTCTWPYFRLGKINQRSWKWNKAWFSTNGWPSEYGILLYCWWIRPFRSIPINAWGSGWGIITAVGKSLIYMSLIKGNTNSHLAHIQPTISNGQLVVGGERCFGIVWRYPIHLKHKSILKPFISYFYGYNWLIVWGHSINLMKNHVIVHVHLNIFKTFLYWIL